MASHASSTNDEREAASRPFWASTPARTTRRGHFWIPGERVLLDGKTYQRGPMYVAWEAPDRVTRPHPVALVHGGTWQGTAWGDTPDGRPGWAQRFVEAGYATLVVDRPGHGRSPYHPEVVGPMSEPFPYEEGRHVYFPPEAGAAHTQWPFDPDDAAANDQFIAAFGPLPADLAASQAMDADRLARLLDRVGPAILVTHSASGSDGWLAADRRPGHVVAIVAVEPMSPPFATTPGFGTLEWGITAAPVTYEPPRATAAEVRAADPAALRIPGLAAVPVAVVTSETSTTAPNGPAMVDFLTRAGAAAERVHLPDHGVFGNGHGLMLEKNSDESFAVVRRWLDAHAGTAGGAQTTHTQEVRMSRDLRVVAFMRAKPGQEDAVREAVLACVGPSRAEEGNVSYVAHVDQKDPRLFVVVEHWASAAARDRHLRTPHFAALGRDVDDAGRLSEHVFHVITPIAEEP